MINPTIAVALITGTFSLTQIVVTYFLNNKNAKKDDLIEIMKKDEYERYKTYLVDYLSEAENGIQKRRHPRSPRGNSCRHHPG